MDRMLFAAFTSPESADRALAELSSHGYNPKDISVISRDSRASEVGSIAGNTAAGAVEGATAGGVVGALAGMLAGAGVFPALAGFLIGGPIAAALGLTGMAAAAATGAMTGAVAGGLIGALARLGLTQADAQYYNDIIEKEGILLVIPFEQGGKAEARHILEANQAVKIQEIDLVHA